MDNVDIVDPRFRKMVLANAPLERLAEGFRWLEGPVWFADHRCLFFSDIPNDRVMCWSESGGVSVYRQPSGFENGHARDRQGRLISCSHRQRNITRTEYNGSITVLANSFEGARLNSPNDVIVKSDGSIWFSDPPYGLQTDYEGGKQVRELPSRVYCLNPQSGVVRDVVDNMEGPNGLCFSPDESKLYVVESGLQFAEQPRSEIWVFDVQTGEEGPQLVHGRLFASLHADGVRCDEEGNLWVASVDGVYCFDANGSLLGCIRLPCRVSNLCFGGRYYCRLFLCASQTLYALYTNCRGVQRP